MDIISKLFSINDSNSCIYGATIIDVNTDSGYDKNRMLPNRNDSNFTLKTSIYFYPLIKEIQNGFKSKSFPFSLMDTWINGFIPITKGISSPENICLDAVNVLERLSIIKFNQVINSKSIDLIETLFYFFKFYKQKDRILNLDGFTEENKESLINRGLVCDKWLKDPISIRYVIRKEGKLGVPDYLYFIGGSDLLLDDNFDLVYETLHNTYRKYIFKNPVSFSDKPNKFWCNLSENFYDDNGVIPENRNAFAKVSEFNRILSGIICIRNYLYYAYHEMGIETIIDFNENDIKKVSTKKILDNYEDIYQYCKTISLLSKKDSTL